MVDNGVKLIASHLAQVKLDAAERDYANKKKIRALEEELEVAHACLEEANSDVANYQVQVKELQYGNSYKALVNERDKWKGLIDTLRKDKAALTEEVNRLHKQSGTIQEHVNTTEYKDEDLKKTDISPMLENEIQHLRNQLIEKNVEIRALRNKLDRELELKWEKTHETVQPSSGWQQSLFDSFAEVLYSTNEEEDTALPEDVILKEESL